MTSPTSAPSPLPSSAPLPPPPSSSAEATAAAAVAVPVVVVDRGAQLERAVMQSHIVWSMLLPRWLPCCRPTTCPVGFTTWRYDRSTMFDDDSLTTNITLSEGFDMLTVVAEAMFPLTKLIAKFLLKKCENGAFSLCARIGAVRVAGHVATLSPPTHNSLCDSLDWCCKSGRLGFAQWLCEWFSVDAADVRSNQNRVLRNACESGHLDVVRWLVSAFNLAAADVRSRDCMALKMACSNGHLELVTWLADNFQLGTCTLLAKQPIAAADKTAARSAFQNACGNGHLEVAQWLAKRFSLDLNDVRIDKCYAFWMACMNGHLPVVEWLVKGPFRFGYNGTDDNLTLAAEMAKANCRIDVLLYLRKCGLICLE